MTNIAMTEVASSLRYARNDAPRNDGQAKPSNLTALSFKMPGIT
jgi:hypothetical protein